MFEEMADQIRPISVVRSSPLLLAHRLLARAIQDSVSACHSPPRALVKVIGQAPLGATVYRLQRLRCRLCDAIFTAPLPAGVASYPKYDASCASMIALLRYGSGLPHFRLEGLPASLYVPLLTVEGRRLGPTQWDIVSKAVAGPGRPSRS